MDFLQYVNKFFKQFLFQGDYVSGKGIFILV